MSDRPDPLAHDHDHDHDRTRDAWRARREPAEVVHLDVAACGRASRAVLDAAAGQAAREAAIGGYPAEAEAAPRVAAARAALAGLLGDPALEVALTTGAAAAFRALLDAWPRPARRPLRVGVLPSEYGGNLMALRAAGARGEVALTVVASGEHGRVDLDALPAALAGLDLLCLDHVASHRGVLQPAAEVGAACRDAGVPLLLDAAQSLGHVDSTGTGAAAVVGTARKWLCGPRGVGFAAVAPDLLERLAPRALGLPAADWDDSGLPRPVPGPARLEPGEAATAGRVALAAALDDLTTVGVAPTLARLAALGPVVRARLDGAGGWRVGEPVDEPTAIVTLHPPARARADAACGVRDRLLAAGVLTTVVTPHRAPGDLPRPALRVSLGAWCEPADVDTVGAALADAAAAA